MIHIISRKLSCVFENETDEIEENLLFLVSTTRRTYHCFVSDSSSPVLLYILATTNDPPPSQRDYATEVDHPTARLEKNYDRVCPVPRVCQIRLV